MQAMPLKLRLMKECMLRSLKRMDVNANAHNAIPAGTYSALDSSAICAVCAAWEFKAVIFPCRAVTLQEHHKTASVCVWLVLLLMAKPQPLGLSRAWGSGFLVNPKA